MSHPFVFDFWEVFLTRDVANNRKSVISVHDWCDWFISVCGLRLLRDRLRRGIKTLMSTTWAHTLWRSTYQTLRCVWKAINSDGCSHCDALSLGAYLPDLRDIFRCVSLNERKCEELNSSCVFLCMNWTNSVSFKPQLKLFSDNPPYFTASELLLLTSLGR